MPKTPADKPTPPPTPISRWMVVLTGVIIGAVWGAIMWGITAAVHGSASAAVFAYLVITMAMIGGGVAAFFGAVGVKRRGESLRPRLWKR
jgi:hypothetical protein